MKATYIITYKAYDINNVIIKEGKFKVKNQLSELNAKVNFEEYLKRKFPSVNYLYISECEIDIINKFNNIFGGSSFNGFDGFNDIFK